MIKCIRRVVLILLLVFFCSFSVVKAASYTTNYILFSNIASGNPSGLEKPNYRTPIPISGKRVNGSTFISLQDLTLLGAIVSIDSTDSDIWYVNINGQLITFCNGSTNYTVDYNYTVIDRQNDTIQSYPLHYTGVSDLPAQIIDGVRYVRFTDAAKQCGSLLVTYNSTTNQAEAFHFRVSGSISAHTDNNTYIVGGPWLVNWAAKSTWSIAPHFKMSEMWSRLSQSSDPDYYNQIKISVKQLQVAENVRHYYNHDSPMTINCAFRSWAYNRSISNVARSFHSRGRAWDASNGAYGLYSQVYNEFKGSYSAPTVPVTNIYRSRVSGTSADLSQGYEIEKMPQNSSTWLHMQTPPQEGSDM